MVAADGEQPTVRLTKRGAAKRAAIVDAASELMYTNGVASTSLPEVLSASGASKSQFYRHFADKAALVHAVIALRAEQILAKQTERLRAVEDLRGLRRWGDAFVQRSALRRGAWGCELGSLAAELADNDEVSRSRLAHHFNQWEALLAAAFDRMKDRGVLRSDTDTARLAIAVMAAIQGGYLLAQTAHDSTPMSVAVAMALEHAETHTPR